jgi:hypothetical protein
LILHELDAISGSQQEFWVQMKGFGFRLVVAFVCLSASVALAGDKNTTENSASAKPCGILVSEQAYAQAPIARTLIDRALQSPRLGPRIAQLLEAIVWITDQEKPVWEKIASGLRNAVYNPVPANSFLNSVPTYLRTEKGRAELLRVLEGDFTTPASYETLEVVAEVLDRYPKVPYLPPHGEALSQLLTALTLSGAKSFYTKHFHTYHHAFITFAAHHWVNFSGDALKLRDQEAAARRLVRENFIPEQFQQLLHNYMIDFINFALNDLWAAILSESCDMLALIDKHIGAFAHRHLGNNFEERNLLRAALIWSLIGPEVRDGQRLRKEILSTFNGHLRQLVEEAIAEFPPPTVPNVAAAVAQAATAVSPDAARADTFTPNEGAIHPPSPPRTRAARPASSRRREKRDKAAALNEQVRPHPQAAQASKPTYPPLTDDMRAALLEGRANFQSDNNINFQQALRITERLLGNYRTSASSHYVFHNPYSDRHVFNFQRHGNDLYPSNGRQLRHLITQMIEIYKIDEE